MEIRPIDPGDQPFIRRLMQSEWGSPMIASYRRMIDATALPGFIVVVDDAIAGVITYDRMDTDCEIVTLNSLRERMGVGTALVKAVTDQARADGCSRVWLVTTNDNIPAIRFYQRRGFTLVAAYINEIQEMRKQKPSIPKIGMENIPIEHMLAFTYFL